MMRLSRFILLPFLIFMLSCGIKKTDQFVDPAATAPVEKKNDTLLAKMKAQSRPTETADSTIQIRTMRWQNVIVNENGTSYEFIDNTGNPYSCMINMPNFDFYNNKYFEAKYAQGAQFPTITMKAGVNETWYRVTIKKESRADENGVTTHYNIIKAIDSLN